MSRQLPPPRTDDVLARRFSVAGGEPVDQAPAPAAPARLAAAPDPDPVTPPVSGDPHHTPAAVAARPRLDPATRRTLDVEARRMLAVRRKYVERARDLEHAVSAAAGVAGRDEIVSVLAAAGLPQGELPANVVEVLAGRSSNVP